MPSILSNKEKLQEAIEKTNSTSEALVYLGLRNAGGNFKQFHKYAKQFGLEEKKYNKEKFLSSNQFESKPLEEYLVKDSSLGSSKLKKKVIAAGLLKNICNECGIGPEWNNKLLSLQLDHINGIHSDNRIENLRIICPNCHTQTHNFGSKNKIFADKTHLKCANCKGFRSTHSKSGLCVKCVDKTKVRQRPSKETLLQQIEELGYSGTGRFYGVSDNTIRNWVNGY